MTNSNCIAHLLEKAKLLKNQQNFEAAVEILEDLYKKHPDSKEVKKSLIETLFAYGGFLNDYYIMEYEKARHAFERITNLSPNNYRAHYNLGIAYFNLGEIKNAKNCFNKALRIKPDYKYCLYNLGLVYENSEEYEEALNYYEQALEIDPIFTYALSAQTQLRRKLDELKRMRSK